MNNKQRVFLNRIVGGFNCILIGLSLSMVLLGFWFFLWPLFVGGVVYYYQRLGREQ